MSEIGNSRADAKRLLDRMVMVRLVDAREDVGCYVVYVKNAWRYLPRTYSEQQAARQFLRAIGAL